MVELAEGIQVRVDDTQALLVDNLAQAEHNQDMQVLGAGSLELEMGCKDKQDVELEGKLAFQRSGCLVSGYHMPAK